MKSVSRTLATVVVVFCELSLVCGSLSVTICVHTSGELTNTGLDKAIRHSNRPSVFTD